MTSPSEMPESVKAAVAQCWQAAASEAGKEIADIDRLETAEAALATARAAGHHT